MRCSGRYVVCHRHVRSDMSDIAPPLRSMSMRLNYHYAVGDRPPVREKVYFLRDSIIYKQPQIGGKFPLCEKTASSEIA